jgi:hypothetical protein
MGGMSDMAIAGWVPTAGDFSVRLAMVRHMMGWNAKEAALACAIPAGSWRQWETFGSKPRNLAEIADKIADRTGVDAYWLMTGRTLPGGPTRVVCTPWDLNPEPTDTECDF